MPASEFSGDQADLSTLSLDAAFQLDKVERNQPSNPLIIRRFLERLIDPEGLGNTPDTMDLQRYPLEVNIFNSAIHRVEATPVENIDELQLRLLELLKKLREVSEGRGLDSVGSLKRFCLSLHQSLLTESSQFRHEDEWILSRDD